MLDKPNPNANEPKREIPPAPTSVGGDYNVVVGNVGAGSAIGKGSVRADHIAQGDIVINNGIVAEGTTQFIEMLGDLRQMLEQAKEKGELDPALAKQAIENVETATEMVKKEKKPPKPELLKKLEAVAKVIDAGVDMLTQDNSPVSILIKALPIAVVLIKLATKLF